MKRVRFGDVGEGVLEVGEGDEEDMVGGLGMKAEEGLRGGMIIDGIGMIGAEMTDEIGIIDEIATTEEIEIEMIDRNEIVRNVGNEIEVGRTNRNEVLVTTATEIEMKTARKVEITTMTMIKNDTTKIENINDEELVLMVATKDVIATTVTTTMTIEEVVVMTTDATTMTEDETMTVIATEIVIENMGDDTMTARTVLADETMTVDDLPASSDTNLKTKNPANPRNRPSLLPHVTLVAVIAGPPLPPPPPHRLPPPHPVTVAVVPPPPDEDPRPPFVVDLPPRPHDPDLQIGISPPTVPPRLLLRGKSRRRQSRRDEIVLVGIGVDGRYRRSLVAVVHEVRTVRRRETRRRREYVFSSRNDLTFRVRL